MFTRIKMVLPLLVVAAVVLCPLTVSAVIIDVDAGSDATICYGTTLDLGTLGATISGDVTDGTWFAIGDGHFTATGGNTVRFSIGGTYQPGATDIANGNFKLILVSDDPDGIGPLTEVSDEVTVLFINSPPLVCNSSINVSLAESCEQQLSVFMLLANPQPPYELYNITAFDESGSAINDNLLTNNHVGQQITFTVGHQCTANICGGNIEVADLIAPQLLCQQLEMSCLHADTSQYIELPIPTSASIVSQDSNVYVIAGLDACGEVSLWYEDLNIPTSCASGFSERIIRDWYVEDIHGNTNTCTQIINFRTIGIDSVIAPRNYDDLDPTRAALHCDGNWERLPNGYPSPNHTGRPEFGSCSNIEASSSDLFFDECGGSYKLVRKWLVIDWCTSQSIDINQVIKIKDAIPPVFNCISDTIIYTDTYSCVSEQYQVMFMDSVSDCSDWTYEITITDGYGIDRTADYVDGMTVAGLPLGVYTLGYVLTDACFNADTCNTTLQIIDNKVPFAICDEYTTVAIQNHGGARLQATSVDDGSYDNCGIATHEVRKMTDVCNQNTSWGTFVNFCCSEVGDTVLVEYKVTDNNGLSNSCMVSVFVEDNIAPQIYCPDDITISCSYDINMSELDVFGQIRTKQSEVEPIYIYDTQNNGLVGYDGYFTDNCGASVSDTAVMNMDCGAGSIVRTFTVTDLMGESVECTQTISIVNDDTFTYEDIIWPTNYDQNGCDTLDALPSNTGEPVFIGEHCSNPAHTYEDQVFYADGGVCVKILRHWAVIDWCLHELDPQAASWTYIQEIKLNNTEAPIIAHCEDRQVCDLDDCGTHNLVEYITAIDDCTAPDYLKYTWSIDFNNDGVINQTGVTDTIMTSVPYGTHKVYWQVTDGCSNASECEYLIDVVDCKLPTPYCRNSITTTLMPTGGVVTLSAAHYNIDSYDNCTAQENLKFSFSENVNDTLQTFTCDDIPNGIAEVKNLEMWVTDEAGNQDYCSIEVILQDNSDTCPDGDIAGRISGTVATRTGQLLSEVGVRYDCIIDDFDGMAQTNQDGRYESPQIPEYLPYGVRPNFDGGLRGDVNSIDLVFIQRHILGLDTLDTPYDIVAADVTKNNRIQPSDLLLMRKFILGLVEEFPKASKWDFIPADYQFADPLDPFDYRDSTEIDVLFDEETADFIAIRMGNVNGQYNFTANKNTEQRSGTAIGLEYKVESAKTNGTYIITILAAEDINYDGLQLGFELEHGQIQSLNSSLLTSLDYYIDDNKLNIAKVNIGGQLYQGDEICKLVATSDELFLRSEKDYDSFVYNSSTVDVVLSKQSSHETDTERLSIAVSNPFTSDLHIDLQNWQEAVNINIYTINGQLIYSNNVVNQNEVQVDSQVFPSSGTYILEVVSDSQQLTEKVVKI